jgi:hypothetical protein
MSKKEGVILALAVAAAVVCAAGVLAWRPWADHGPKAIAATETEEMPRSVEQRPAPVEQEPKAVLEYLASEEFAAMPEAHRQEYFAKAQPVLREAGGPGSPAFAELSQEQRQRLGKNIGPLMRKEMQRRIDKFFELPPEERDAYLDDMIDEMESWRRRHRPPPPTRDSDSEDRRPRPGRGFSPARLKGMIETGDPVERAKMVEFGKAMRRRMEERGIKPPWERR